MPDEVVTQAPVESANAPVEAVEAAVEETPTQAEGEDVATYKKRLAGKDQALTATKKELDALKKEAEDLKRWKAEIEEKNLSEYEKAQLKIKALEDTLARQQEEARQERLARQHPLYAQFRQDTANLDEEARAAAFEKFLDSRVQPPLRSSLTPALQSKSRSLALIQTIHDVSLLWKRQSQRAPISLSD